MPEAEHVHHIVEDFTTFWDGEFSHVAPLRRFIDKVLNRDLRRISAEVSSLQTSTSMVQNSQKYRRKYWARSLVRSPRSLVRLLRTTRFARALPRSLAHFARSQARGTVNNWMAIHSVFFFLFWTKVLRLACSLVK